MSAWAQDDLAFKIDGRITDLENGGNIGGVTVTMYQDGKSIGTTQTSSNGKYRLTANGPSTSKYKIVYSKTGIVSKTIELDPSAIYVEDLPAGNLVPTPPFDLEMFAERPDVDFSFLDTEPVAKMFWSERKGLIDFDRVAYEKTKKKIEDLLLKAEKEAAEAEMKYQQAIQKADEHYNAKEYEDALAKYEEALTYKPKEPYPAERIVELDALIAAQKEADLLAAQQDEEYNNLIKAADNLRDGGELEAAVTKYQEALTKKDEQYPKDQIADLNAQIEAKKKEAENQAAYDEAIKRGDMLFKQKSYPAAKTKYEEAAKLKPSEEYPKKKLAELEALEKEQEELAAKKQKYDDAIAAADQAFGEEDYQTAKDKYEEALSYEASSTYAKGRKQICEDKLAELAAANELQQKIDELMQAGKADMDNKTYANAKSKFEEVLTLDAEHEEAKTQLALAEQKLLEQAERAEELKKFEQLVQEGDEASKGEDFETAISKYEEALGIETTPEVNQKLQDAKDALAAQKSAAENKAKYDQLMSEADALMISEDLNGAKAKYEEASALDPSQTLPKDKIAEIDKLLGEQQAEADRQAKLDQAIKDGDHHFELANWSEADKRYREALEIDPGNAHATARLAEIEGKLKEEAEAAATKDKYDQAIKEGNDFFDSSEWEKAKAKYEEALTQVPGDEYATQRISELDKKLAEAADAKELQDKIDGLLAEGKSLKDSEKYTDAKTKYEEVLGLDAGNSEATQAIKEINDALAALKSEAEKEEAFAKLKEEGFALADEKKYVEAKAKLNEALSLMSDTEVENKIKEIDDILASEMAAEQLEENYNNAIAEAQNRESAKDLRGALEKYKEASSLKPEETLPKDKIAELEALIRENEDLAKLDEEYNAAIENGANLLDAKDYAGAKAAYQKASGIKPEESLPKEKIAEIDGLIAANKEEQERIDQEYKKFMDKGDELMAAENYLDAIEMFNSALALKPSEKEPVEKAEEARRLEEAKGDADREYEKILTVAQKKIDAGDFDRARELAERAKGLKPADPRPQTLLDKIDQLEVIEREYNELLKKGDDLASSKNYSDAKAAYEEASRKKPSEQLPKDKIAEMDKLMDSAASIAQKEELYIEYMADGNKYQGKESYEQALSSFQDALSVKPGDDEAQRKIDEVQKILDDIANKEAEDVGKKNAYNKLIKEADALFSKKEWLEAKKKYDQALIIDPSSEYAYNQSEECTKRDKDRTRIELEKEYRKIIDKADSYFDKANYDKAKGLYNRALGFRPDDQYPKDKLDEIEAILNPKIVSSAELEDLGDPVDNSIMDGGFILDKSRKELELAKGVAVEGELKDIRDSESEMTSDKTKDHYESSNEIYAVQMQIMRDEGEKDLHQQALSDALRKAETELGELQSQDNDFEHNSNVVDQNVLYEVNKEVALEYGEDISVYSDNAAVMKAYNTAQSEVVSEQIKNDHSANVDTDKGITKVKNDVDDGMREDYEKRNNVTKEIQVVEKAAGDLHNERAKGKYEDQLGNKNELRKIEVNLEEKYSESAEGVAENNEKLIKVRGEVLREDEARIDQKELHLQEADRGMSEVKLYIQEDSQDRDRNRLNSVEVLKKGNKELAEEDHAAYNKAMEHNVGNKEKIETSVKQNGEVLEREKEAHDLKVEYMNKVEDQIVIEYTEDNKSDEEERLKAKKTVEDVYTDVQTTSAEEVVKTKEKSATLNDVTKTIDAEKSNQTIGEQEKHYKAADQIGDVDNTLKAAPKQENELGQEYPEGVSQENFTRKDKNGVVNTFITRRIVVIDGHADVFVRTQTLNGITYTKNGKPIVQHVWNSQTQGPHLERHF